MTTTETGHLADAAHKDVVDAYRKHERAQHAATRTETALAAALETARLAGCSMRAIAAEVGTNHVRLMRIRERH